MSKAIRTFFVLLFVSSYSSVYADTIKPGNYEGLILAVNSDGSFIGWFEQVAGLDFRPTCQFAIKGKVSAGVGEGYLNALESGEHKIQIYSKEKSIELKIAENKKFKCTPEMEELGPVISLSMVEEGSWVNLRVVHAEKAFFYSNPSENSRRSAYVVKGNMLRVVREKGPWLEVEYSGISGITRGWVKNIETADAYAL